MGSALHHPQPGRGHLEVLHPELLPPRTQGCSAGCSPQGACAWWLLPKNLPVLGSTLGTCWGPRAHPGPVPTRRSVTLRAQPVAQGGWLGDR